MELRLRDDCVGELPQAVLQVAAGRGILPEALERALLRAGLEQQVHEEPAGGLGTCGLDRFLAHAHRSLSETGQVLLDSLDVRITDDPGNLAYHEANRQAGRYLGEIRIQSEFRGERGPFGGWLQVDAETLRAHAELAGWHAEVVHREESGDYLARLTKQTRE